MTAGAAARAAAAGTSGTPLAKKLGIAAGDTLALVDAPAAWHEWVAPLPGGVHFAARPRRDVRLVHAFFTERKALVRSLTAWRRTLADDAVLWISWPKKAAKMRTDLDEDAVRAAALPLCFVDVKVCAVSEVWSGLKLVVRKELRGAPKPAPAKGRGA